jgi:hypothetical protein
MSTTKIEIAELVSTLNVRYGNLEEYADEIASCSAIATKVLESIKTNSLNRIQDTIDELYLESYEYYGSDGELVENLENPKFKCDTAYRLIGACDLLRHFRNIEVKNSNHGVSMSRTVDGLRGTIAHFMRSPVDLMNHPQPYTVAVLRKEHEALQSI